MAAGARRGWRVTPAFAGRRLALLLALAACGGRSTASAPEVVGSITLSAPSTSVSYGQTLSLAATVRSSSGATLVGRAVAWSSSNDAIAPVTPAGVVTAGAVRGGSAESATITATSEGQSASLAISVLPIPVSSVTLSLTQLALSVGQTAPVGVTLRDATGSAVTGRPVTWSTSAPAVATVSPAGGVTAVAAGSATITATSEGRSAMVPVTVTAVPAGPPSVERQVNATQTDNAITPVPAAGEAPHVAINPSPSVTARGRLLVFLPGTQGRPSQYSYLLRAGAARGFHAIGVNYMNQMAMGTLCQTSTNPECYWTARTEVIFGNGTPVAGQTAVTRANSLVNRISKLLAWLHATYPAEGWGQYLRSDNTVDWSLVILAGHSQGGGHVGVLAKSVLLSRAVYFSSPEDWNDLTDRPAPWTGARPNVTPASRQYGFGADADPLVPNAHAFAHWDNLGMDKPATGPVLVDGGSPPFGNARQLRTALPFNPASTALTPALRHHGITVVDVSTPLDGSGRPLFDTNGVWAYLCFQ